EIERGGADPCGGRVFADACQERIERGLWGGRRFLRRARRRDGDGDQHTHGNATTHAVHSTRRQEGDGLGAEGRRMRRPSAPSLRSASLAWRRDLLRAAPDGLAGAGLHVGVLIALLATAERLADTTTDRRLLLRLVCRRLLGRL